MFIAETEFKRFIVDSGLVSKKDMAEAEEEAIARGISIAEILVSGGKLSDDDVRKMHARVSGIPFIRLKGHDIDSDALRLIPEPIARKHGIIAFKRASDGISIAMLHMDGLPAIDFVKKSLGTKILPHLTDADSMRSALLRYQKILKDEFGEIIKRETDAEPLVDALLKHALAQNASDIHIEPGEKDVLIRYRIDGLLHDAMVLSRAAGASVTARIKGLAGLSVDENRFPQEGRFKAEMSGEKLFLRVSVVPTFRGEKSVISIARDNASSLTLEQLGFHGESLERVRGALKSPGSMILVVGPRGAGKSTTLYAMIDVLNTPKVNISTIEDPIKSEIRRVNQVSVRPDIGFSFVAGLRSLIRQNSDVIMIGQMENTEVASLAANVVLGGRLVLAALPAKSASFVAARLIDMRLEPFLIASTLSAVVGQRLVRKLSHTKERKALTRSELAALGKVVNLDRMLGFLREEKVIGPKDGWGQVLFGYPKASKTGSGYEGVICIQEVLRMSATIRALITKESSPAEIESRAKKEGMMTMLEDGIFKAAQGLTSIEEVLRVLSL